MNPDYTELRDKMDRFNEWEKQYFRSLTSEKKMDQFRMLYETKIFIGEKLEAIHEDHLNSLIEVRERLKKSIN